MTVLINSLNQYGVGVISYQEAWMDTTGAFREVLICFIGWMAAIRVSTPFRTHEGRTGGAKSQRCGTRTAGR
jgi:hypothetical protein